MAWKKINDAKLTAIADGFRFSRGTTEQYSLEQMAAMAAQEIEGGSDADIGAKLLTQDQIIEQIQSALGEKGGDSSVIEPLVVTKSGVYEVPEGVDAYSPVKVNVTENDGVPFHTVSTASSVSSGVTGAMLDHPLTVQMTGGKVMARDITWQYYRLTITDMRRDGGSSAVTYASVGELALYDADGNNIALTTDSKECSAISEYSGQGAQYAFDGNPGTIWHSHYSSAPNTTNWVQIKVNDMPEVVSFGIAPRGDTGNSYLDTPYAFTLSKSGTGNDWIEIANYTGLSSGWSKGVERRFTLNV